MLLSTLLAIFAAASASARTAGKKPVTHGQIKRDAGQLTAFTLVSPVSDNIGPNGECAIALNTNFGVSEGFLKLPCSSLFDGTITQSDTQPGVGFTVTCPEGDAVCDVTGVQVCVVEPLVGFLCASVDLGAPGPSSSGCPDDPTGACFSLQANNLPQVLVEVALP